MTAQSEVQTEEKNSRVKCCPVRSRHHHDVRLHEGVHSVGPAHLDPAPVGLVLIDGRCPHIRCAYPGRAGGAPSRPAALGSAAARLAMPKTWPGIISSKPMTWSSAAHRRSSWLDLVIFGYLAAGVPGAVAAVLRS